MNGTSKPSKKLPPTTPGRQRREKQKETDPVEVSITEVCTVYMFHEDLSNFVF